MVGEKCLRCVQSVRLARANFMYATGISLQSPPPSLEMNGRTHFISKPLHPLLHPRFIVYDF